MAKRLSDEKPYTPFEGSLVASVLAPPPPEPEPPAVELAEPVRRRVERLAEKPTGSQRPRRLRSASIERTSVTAPATDAVARPERVRPAPGEERMTATLRLQTAVRDKREFEAFVARLAAALDTTIKPSNVLRVLLAVAQHAEPVIAELARNHVPLKRPPNDDSVAYAEFEQRLVQLVDSAIRRSPPMR